MLSIFSKVQEFEITRPEAEKALNQAGGDLNRAIQTLVGTPES